MRGALYCLGLFLPLCWGCSGAHVVGGEEMTRAALLESSVSWWCDSTCKRLRACRAPDNCEWSGGVCLLQSKCQQEHTRQCVKFYGHVLRLWFSGLFGDAMLG